MRILVTGASGFVGGHLALLLAGAGHKIIAGHCRSALSQTVFAAVDDATTLDLTISADAVATMLKEKQVELIVHAAAMANAGACESDTDGAYRANVIATENLVHACSLLGDGAPRLVYISTDLVFDAAVAPAGGFAEHEEPLPRSVYAQTKAGGEHIVRMRLPDACVMRICLVYAGALGAKSGPFGWLLSGLSEGRDVPLFEDEFRTPVYAGTIARAIDTIARNYERFSGVTLHLAGAERLSRYDFGVSVAEEFQLPKRHLIRSKQSDVSTGAPRSPDVSLASAATYELLGFQPMPIAEALKEIREIGPRP